MTRLARSWVLCVAAFASACTVPPIIPIPEPPNLPAAWGSYSQEYWEGTNCPKVSGTYLMIPSVYRVGEDNKRFLDGNDISFYSLFAFHLADRSSQPQKTTSDKPDFFSIRQVNAERFVLEHNAPAVGEIVRHDFDRAEGDFECVYGFLQFPVSGHYGSIDGMSLNGQDVKKFRMTADGNLVFILSSGPYRSRRSADNLDFVHELYLFRRM